MSVLKGMARIIRGVRERYNVETETHDALGRLKADPNPVEWPVGLKRPQTIHEMFQQMLRSQRVKEQQAALGFETLEDSMDFGDDDDDPLPTTVHELRDMKEEVVAAGAAEFARAERLEKQKAQKEAGKKKEPEQGADKVVGQKESPAA